MLASKDDIPVTLLLSDIHLENKLFELGHFRNVN